LDNQGTIDKSTFGDIKIEGSPAPNTDTKIFENAPGSKMGTLSVDKLTVDQRPVTIPAPENTPEIDPSLSYKVRVNSLIRDIQDWSAENQTAEPKQFHDAFGTQIKLIASQLRNCGLSQITSLYGDEEYPPDIPIRMLESVVIGNLMGLAHDLPDEDAQLHCK